MNHPLGSIGITAKDLMEMEFPEPAWIVPGLITEGLTLIAGKPKAGKSWWALNLSVAVSTGSIAFGRYHVEKGVVIYLALEDTWRRLQDRLSNEYENKTDLENLNLFTQWPRMHEGGYGILDSWLGEHPKAKLVIIDTLAKVREPSKGGNIYEKDYAAISILKKLADKHGVAVIVIHHLNKLQNLQDPYEAISGSTGMTGAADSIAVLQAKADRRARLIIKGRDIQEQNIEMMFEDENKRWIIIDDSPDQHITDERQKVINLLNETGKPMKSKEISEHLGKKENAIRQLLFKLTRDDM